MSEESITGIVDEVLRRVMILLNFHKGLVLIREDTDFSLLNLLLLSMKNNGFSFDVIIDSNHCAQSKIDQSLDINYINKDWICSEDEILKYEAIIVSNLNIIEISKLTHLNIDNNFLHLIFKILKQGKKIHGLSKDLEIKNNKSLNSLSKQLSNSLEELGLEIINKPKQNKCIRR